MDLTWIPYALFAAASLLLVASLLLSSQQGPPSFTSLASFDFEEVRFDHLGAFTYSSEESTPAATCSSVMMPFTPPKCSWT